MNHKKAILYGIAIWVFVFVVAMFAFPLRQNERPLFESIMPVALVLSTTVASVLYLQKVDRNYFTIGYCLGLVWLGINLVIDLFAFSQGPMKMAFTDYLKDIGVTYLLIPIIPTGIGYLLDSKK